MNNKNRNYTKGSLKKLLEQSDERLDKYLVNLDAGDVDEWGTVGAAQIDHLETKITNKHWVQCLPRLRT